MNFFSIVKYLLAITGIVFLFINWKISIALYILASIFHIIPFGPSTLLGVISGYLIIFGLIYIFINLKIGVILIFISLIVMRFRIWADKKVNKFNKNTKK